MRTMLLRKNVIAFACAGVLLLAALSGCTTGPSESEQAQQANRDYMAQVNQSMESLEAKLGSFIDAVSRGDVVNMRTQADNAYAALDALAKIEAPEGLEDIQTSYVDGTNALKEALDDYIALYTEIESATADNPFDWASYDNRISQIKSKYDEGIGLLQSGDNAAAAKK
ncbi:hypothetical protein [Adlercreutzia sp. ZJ141]|uniref:hypothetical protein n=1 Tax=Adlercreutzia sp. ZJ141 TaxID=2709406 RepID=UPI001F150CEF|nr:hypothetical protein [Adlercreutzia sp. ZJ141]